MTFMHKHVVVFAPHQERAEEDEGDKVGVGEGAATLGLRVP